MTIFQHLKRRCMMLFFHYWRVAVCFSSNKQTYYVKYLVNKRRAALSVEKHSIESVPPTNRTVDGWFQDIIVIEKENGEKYWRSAWPFVFYKLPPHDVVEYIKSDDDLVLDYKADTERIKNWSH